jgi:hypothetical protein
MILGRLSDGALDGWFKCLRCFRYFTKDPAHLFCYDCVGVSRPR